MGKPQAKNHRWWSISGSHYSIKLHIVLHKSKTSRKATTQQKRLAENTDKTCDIYEKSGMICLQLCSLSPTKTK